MTNLQTMHSRIVSAETMEDAQGYMKYGHRQLGKFGYTLVKWEKVEDYALRYIYKDKTGQKYQSIYILNGYRGQDKYRHILEQSDLPVVTLETCHIEQYLDKHDIEYKLYHHTPEYWSIANFYQDQRAKRSGIPLIYHIDEGCTILKNLGHTSEDRTMKAYCLHPLLQDDKAFNENWENFSRIGSMDASAVALAMEYRHVANSYLSTGKPEDFKGFTNLYVKNMLIADKVQNFKDFMSYHYGIHKRSGELYEYFLNWEDLLNINYNDYIPFITYD